MRGTQTPKSLGYRALVLCTFALMAMFWASPLPAQTGVAHDGAKWEPQDVRRRPIVVAGGGETNFVNDTFTEASDTVLSSHTPELGGTWVDHTDAAYTDTLSIIGSTDRAWKSSGTSAGMYYNDATPPSADYCVEGIMFNHTVLGSSNTAIAWRVDTASNTMMIFQLNNGTGWRIRKIVSGTQTTIRSEDTTTEIPGVGDTKTMKACSSGNTHTAYVNGTLLGTVGGSDSSVTAAGKVGMRFNGTYTTTTGPQFNSFRAFTP